MKKSKLLFCPLRPGRDDRRCVGNKCAIWVDVEVGDVDKFVWSGCGMIQHRADLFRPKDDS